MKTIFFTLFFSVVCFSQNTKEIHYITAEATIIAPLGKLSNKFNYAQSYGFWVKEKTNRDIYASLGIAFLILNKGKNIQYKTQDSTYNISSENYGIDFGFRITKKKQFSKNNSIEVSNTLAIHYLSYNFPNRKSDESDNKKGNGFKNTTGLFAPEISFIHKNMGVKIQYRYTPFSVIDGFESKFGSQSIAFGLVYKQ